MSYETTHDWTAGDFIRASDLQKMTNAALAAAFARFELGGSRETPIAGTAWVEAWESRPFWLPDDAATYEGLTFTLFVELKNSDALGVMRARLRRTDTDAIIWTSADTSATAFEEQSFTFTPIAGVKYAIDFQKDDDTLVAWGFGYVIRLIRELGT